MKKLLTVAAALLPLAAFAQYEPVAPAAPGPSYESRRSPWYIGFGLGTGDGTETFPGGTLTFKEDHELFWGPGVSPTNVTVNFKVGMTVSPNLLVGFDITAIRSQYDNSGWSTAIQINNYDAVATWFPQGEGLFLRGGAGLSNITWTLDTSTSTGSSSESGFNVLGGVGYAFWIGQSFNLTLNADYSFQSYSGSSIDSSRFWNLWVGFDWY